MRRIASALEAAVILLSIVTAAHAHDPGVARASLIEHTSGDLVLRVVATPALAPLFVPPQLPDRCRFVDSPSGSRANEAILYRFACLQGRLTAADSLHLPWGREGVMLEARWAGRDSGPLPTQVAFFPREGPGIDVDLSELAAGSGTLGTAAIRFTRLGIEHIVLGFDHLLFVLCLLLVVVRSGTRLGGDTTRISDATAARDTERGWTGNLVKTVTAFTVAHSITLALAKLDVVRVPSTPVEASIALSIALLAAEILRHEAGGDTGLTYRSPWVVAFAFGLLHGLGFAGALADLGLPQREIPVALLFFNVGVELGQLAFVGVVLGLTWVTRSALRAPLHRATVALAYAVGGVATYWFTQRTWEIMTV